MNGAGCPDIRLLRRSIDGTDAAMRRLLKLRLQLVARVTRAKRHRGFASRDAQREHAMQVHARRDAQRIGLNGDQATALLQHSLDACQRAFDTETSPRQELLMSASFNSPSPAFAEALLAWLPPPRRWGPWLLRLPMPGWQWLSEHVLAQALAAALKDGSLEPITGRSLAIEIDDLAWRWVVRVNPQRIEVLSRQAPAEATVRGSLTDLLLLASRIDDADTLFFQRRLQLTGDVELGLCARNLLDRLSWQQVPLALRIPLNRVARLARDAREAHRQRSNNGTSNSRPDDRRLNASQHIDSPTSAADATLEAQPDLPMTSEPATPPQP